MVFQQFNLWAHMTILENVMEAPVTVLKRDRKDVETAARAYLDKVGIWRQMRVSHPAQLYRRPATAPPPSPARSAWSRARFFSTSQPRRSPTAELEQEVIRVIKALAPPRKAAP